MKLPKNITKEYIYKFFVGLLEGDGTISSSLDRSSLRIAIMTRFVIALKRVPENIQMLNQIQSIIGGVISLVIKKTKMVILKNMFHGKLKVKKILIVF